MLLLFCTLEVWILIFFEYFRKKLMPFTQDRRIFFSMLYVLSKKNMRKNLAKRKEYLVTRKIYWYRTTWWQIYGCCLQAYLYFTWTYIFLSLSNVAGKRLEEKAEKVLLKDFEPTLQLENLQIHKNSRVKAKPLQQS